MTLIMRVMVLSAGLVYGLGLNSALAQHGHQEGGPGHDGGVHKQGKQAGHSHEKASAHGGAVTMSQEFHVETVFLPNQVRLYLYDREQNPMHVKHWEKGLVEATGVVKFRDPARSTATLEFVHARPDDYTCASCCGYRSRKPGKCPCGMKLSRQKSPEGPSWACPMHPAEHSKGPGKCSICGMAFSMLDYLAAEADLKGLSAGDAKVSISLKNLPGAKEQTLQITQPFVPSEKHKEHAGRAEQDRGHAGPKRS